MVKKIIIADINWWVSLVISRFENKFAIILEMDTLEFVSCEQLETEIQNLFKKQRLQKFLAKDVMDTFWISFRQWNKTVNIVSTISICRDPKDNYLLALAKDANADFLITGDKDLLVLEKFENTIICTLTDFINKYLKQ